MKKTLYSCPECGSDAVMYDAYVMMNDEGDVRTFDAKVCDDCGTHFNTAVETEVDEPEATTEVRKQCTMNCGPALGDTRSDAQRKADCTDCLQIDVAVPDPVHKPCKGMNCTSTDGTGHSLECEAEHSAAIAGGVFLQSGPVLSGDELLYTVRAMRSFGGSFVQHLGSALQVADLSNSARLQSAFPELLTTYGPGTYFYEQVKPN